MRAHCAPLAATFSVAAVLGGQRKRLIGSSCGGRPRAVHSRSWILWWTMPASGCPAGTCILSSNSSSQRTSSRRSEILFLFSGIDSLPSPKSANDEPRYLPRSYWLSSVQTEMPALTTYLPWSPASYQPLVTSSEYVQPELARHGTLVSPLFGSLPTWPAG